MAAKWFVGLALLSLLACDRGEKPAAPAAPPVPPAAAPPAAPIPPIADRVWELSALGDQSDPVGMDGQPLRLRLDSATSRAGGYAGCNSYGGAYELQGSTLKFGGTTSTKMFCEPVQGQEDAYLKALGAVSSWQLSGDVLTLRGAGPELRFREATP